MGPRVSGPACGRRELGTPRGASSLSGAPGTSAPAPRACELRGSAPAPLGRPAQLTLSRGPPEPREAQAGSEAQQCASGDAQPEVRRPAVRRGRSRRKGGAREVHARWRPPGLAAGRRGYRAGYDAYLLKLLTPNGNLYSSAFGLIFVSRFSDVFPDVFVLFLVFGWDESFN